MFDLACIRRFKQFLQIVDIFATNISNTSYSEILMIVQDMFLLGPIANTISIFSSVEHVKWIIIGKTKSDWKKIKKKL